MMSGFVFLFLELIHRDRDEAKVPRVAKTGGSKLSKEKLLRKKESCV